MRWIGRGVGVMVGCLVSTASAAELPPHGPLRVLIVSDGVNPNNLSDAELTQPGDLSAALSGPGTGLSVDEVLEVDSQCVDDALAALADPSAYTTMIYFAHRSARGCDASDRQAALTDAVEAFLVAGGGVVMYHHGVYQDAGKEGILQLLGATAGSIQWDTNVGQNIINVADGHFVTGNGVEYPMTVDYADAAHGVPMGNYAYFNNTPDERYPALDLLTEAGEDRKILFASDYDNSGSTHVIGYDLQRAGWAGRVVFYQSAEYQPQALDDVDGNNFQILANALVHVSPAGEPPGETDGTGTSTGEPETDTGDEPGTGTAGETGSPTTAPGSTGGEASTAGEDSPTAGEGPGSEGPTGDAPTSGGESAGTGGGATTTGTASGGETMDAGGCGCRSRGSSGALLAVFGLLLVRRRGAAGQSAAKQ